MANVKDLAASFVATAPSPATSGTSLVVTAATGANFPTAPFYVTATPLGSLSTPTTSEILLVTAVSTDTFTITRAQKSTTAKSIAVGWVITNGIYTADVFSTITFGELMSGTVNGTNKVFTTSSPATSIEVFKNGVRMRDGGNDYTVTNSTTITFVTAPASGAILLANYIIGNQVMISGSNSLVTDQTPTGTVNSANTTFTTAQSYIPGSLQVFINGSKQKRITHFTETSPGTGSFTMSDAPLTGDDIMVSYQYTYGVTANADTVDGFNASSTPTANTILPLNSSGKITVDAFGTGASNSEAVGASSTTTSTSYTATLADTIVTSVTVVIGANGLALVNIGGFAVNSGANINTISVAASGTNTIASSDNRAFQTVGTSGTQAGIPTLWTGLNPGSTTFTLQYKVSAGTGTFAARRLSVIPL